MLACYIERPDDDIKTAIGIDDDTITCYGIDADTTTARHFRFRNIGEDSTCIDILSDPLTAKNIVSDCNTARDIHEPERVKGWWEWLMDFLFPIGSAEDVNGIHRKYNRSGSAVGRN